jgi:isocitrate lyase
VKAGLKAIYLSGWQVAADANIAGEMYPDQSLYPVNSVPLGRARINNAFMRATRSSTWKARDDIDYFAPIVADAEAASAAC